MTKSDTELSVHQDDVLAVVRQFVEDLGQDPQKIVPQAVLRDLGVDSLHAVDLVFRFEEKFEVAIPMEDFDASTVGDAVDFILGILSNRSTTSGAD